MTMVEAVLEAPIDAAGGRRAIDDMTRHSVDFVWVATSGETREHRQLIADLATSAKLPSLFGWRENVEAGGLLSYGNDAADMYRHAAGYVDRILRGARPGEMPIQQPTRFELVVNLGPRERLVSRCRPRSRPRRRGDRMRRRQIMATIAGAAFAHPAVTRAQPASRSRAPARVGVLWSGSADANKELSARFRARLRDLGYLEGRTLELHERFADGRLEHLPALARELVDLKADVIVAFPLAAAVAARQATSTIPIVMVYAGNPVGAGLIQNLARPGGNVTGTTSMLPDLGGKQLELISEVLPLASRVAVLFNPTNAGLQATLHEAKAAADAMRLALTPVEVSRVEDIAAAFDAIVQAKADALLVLAEPVIGANRARTIEFAARARLPALYSVADYVRAGGLMAYGNNIGTHIDGAAVYVDKILQGRQTGGTAGPATDAV